MKRLTTAGIIFIIISMITSACELGQVFGSTITPTSINTSTPTSTQTPEETPTLTITLTPTITPTSALSLPVSMGTPFPYQLNQISVQNGMNIRELMQFGQSEPIVYSLYQWKDDLIWDTNLDVEIFSKNMQKLATLPAVGTYCGRIRDSPENGTVHISADGEVAIATYDEVQIYSIEGKHIFDIPLETKIANLDPNYSITCGLNRVFRYSADMKWLAVGYGWGNPTNIYDLAKAKIVTTLDKVIRPLMFTPDGKLLITENTDKSILVFQTSDWTKKATFPAFGQIFDTEVTLSPNGTYLVGYPYGGILTVYNLANGTKLGFPNVACSISSCRGDQVFFSSDGSKMGVNQPISHTGSPSTNILLAFSLPDGRKITAPDSFDTEEWQAALIEIPYLTRSNYGFPYSTVSSSFNKSSDGIQWAHNLNDASGQSDTSEPSETPTINSTNVNPPVSWSPNPVPGRIGICISFQDGSSACGQLPPLDKWVSNGDLRTFNGNMLWYDKYSFYLSCTINNNNVMDCNFPNSVQEKTQGIAQDKNETCIILFSGQIDCQPVASNGDMYIESDGSLYTLFKISSSKYELHQGPQATDGLLTTIQIDPQKQVAWFRVVDNGKYLIYAIGQYLTSGSIYPQYIGTLSIDNVYIVSINSKNVSQSLPNSIIYMQTPPVGRFIGFFGNPGYGFIQYLVWDVESQKTIFQEVSNNGDGDAFAFTNDSPKFVYIHRKANLDEAWKQTGVVSFYDLGAKKIVREFAIDLINNGVSAMAFSPDDKVLSIGYNDGTIQLLDATTGSVVASWRGHIGQISNLEISPNGSLLLSIGGFDQYMKIWGIT